MSELTRSSAIGLAAAIRERRVSAREVVEAHASLLERVNPDINAVIVPRYDAARRDAEAADARVASAEDPDSLPPLLGVPCTIKEIIGVEGMPHSAGRRSAPRPPLPAHRADRPPAARRRRHPARAHQRLRARDLGGDRQPGVRPHLQPP